VFENKDTFLIILCSAGRFRNTVLSFIIICWLVDFNLTKQDVLMWTLNMVSKPNFKVNADGGLPSLLLHINSVLSWPYHQMKLLYNSERFQVLTAASMMFRVVFRDVLPCKNDCGPTFQRCVLPWWWRQYAPLKRRSTIILHGSTSQKTMLNMLYNSDYIAKAPFLETRSSR
jgi:hypothetical protein